MPTVRPCLLSLLLAALPLSATAGHAAADLVVTDARIYTADAGHPDAEALAVRAGTLVYVGGNAGARAWIGPKTRHLSLDGKRVLPGLYDSHVHPVGIVDLEVCDLKSAAKSLAAMTEFVRECLKKYPVAPGAWINVRQWNFSNGNEPDAAHPTLRAALDLVSRDQPVQLIGNDGHHGAFNSAALARARDSAGNVVGFSKATLAGALAADSKYVGVDATGEPNGTANEEARSAMGAPDILSVDFEEVMKAPGRVTARLNSAGITGIMDAVVPPETLVLYDTLDKNHELTVRASLAQYYDPDQIRRPDGQPDWERMVASATRIRAKYAHHPLLRADIVKLFADGVLEGNPYAVPPTLPETASLKPYLQPIFKQGPDHHLSVVGYVDTGSPLCVTVRAHLADYEAQATAFLAEHGYHPDQCLVSSGRLQHKREVMLEFARRFHLAGFNLHIHAIGDLPIRTAVDAIEAARAADGVTTTHDALAHLQLVHPDDVARIGRDHLYLAFTYSWAFADPEYDLSVVPFIDHVLGGDDAALHPANGYYEQNGYPVRALRDAGAILIAGSDAPVNSRDPQPFVNIGMAVSRRLPGHPPLNPAQSVPVRDAIDAYTINGARYLERDREAGSLEVGKSADFIVLDRDVLALGDGGHADDILRTKVLETWFQGKRVYAAR